MHMAIGLYFYSKKAILKLGETQSQYKYKNLQKQILKEELK